MSFSLAYYFFSVPIMHVFFFHASRACMDYFFGICLLSLSYIAILFIGGL